MDCILTFDTDMYLLYNSNNIRVAIIPNMYFYDMFLLISQLIGLSKVEILPSMGLLLCMK